MECKNNLKAVENLNSTAFLKKMYNNNFLEKHKSRNK